MSNLAYNPAYTPPPIVAQQAGAQDAMSFIGEVMINGVNLPLQVVEQLRQAGINAISWLTPGELEDAKQAVKFDGRLIDDPEGERFSLRDQMNLSNTERIDRARKKTPRRDKAKSWEEMLKAEREGHPPDQHEHEEAFPPLLAF